MLFCVYVYLGVGKLLIMFSIDRFFNLDVLI